MRKINRIMRSVNDTQEKSAINRIVKNSSWIIADKVYSLFIGLFVTSIIARYFGPEKYGLFNYAFSFISLFSVLSTLGIETLSVKAIVEKKEDEGTILCTSLVLRIIGGIILTVISYSSIQMIEPNNLVLQYLVLVLALVMLVKSFEVIEYWIQAHQRAKISSTIRIISFSIISILKIVLVLNQGSLIHYSIIYIVDGFIISIGLMYAYKSLKVNKVRWKFNVKYGKEILSQSWYIMLSGLMITLFTRMDQLMLGYMMPTQTELGVYSAAVKIATMWYFVPMAIITSFKPLILNVNGSEKKTLDDTQLLYNIIAWVGVFFGIFISIFSNLIVSILYGEAYAKAGAILNISIWAGTFATLGSARSLWLVKEGLQKYSLYSTIIGAGTNILLNLMLIPLIGGYGAALATLATQIVVNIFVFLIFKKTRISSRMIITAFNLRQSIDSIRRFRR